MTTDNAINESQSRSINDLTDQFVRAVGDLVDSDDDQNPVVSTDAAARSSRLAREIGEADGSSSTLDKHVPSSQMVMPTQGFVSNSAAAAYQHLGNVYAQRLAKSRKGGELVNAETKDDRSSLAKLGSGIAKHRFLLALMIPLAIVEYFVGLRFTQTVLELDDDVAHIVALSIPVMFAAASIVMASQIISSQPNMAVRFLRIGGIVLMIVFFSTILLGGLIIGEVIQDDSSSGAVITSAGDSGQTEENDGVNAFAIVRFLAYFCFMLLINIPMFLAHLIDKRREDTDRVDREAMLAEGGSPAERAAKAEIAFLDQFDEAFMALKQTRRTYVDAYIAGVRSTLDVNLVEKWDTTKLEADLPQPEWLVKLRNELRHLETSAYGSPRSTVDDPSGIYPYDSAPNDELGADEELVDGSPTSVEEGQPAGVASNSSKRSGSTDVDDFDSLLGD